MQRGLSKANKDQSFTLTESREYADAVTQHEPASFTKSSTTQTDPERRILATSFGTQTDVPPTSTSISTQTDIPVPRSTAEVEVQTEPISSRSPSPQEDYEALASSSSTVLPPTPKANPTPLDIITVSSPTDLPPSYNQVTSETPTHDILHLLDAEDLSFSDIPDPRKRRDLRIAVETLRIWHSGLKVPLRTSVEVSAEALEEWRALKAEVGIGCRVLDRALEDAAAAAATTKSAAPSSRRRKTGRFYNIYNTYVYGVDGYNGLAGRMPWGGLTSHALLCVGASAVVFFVMSPFLAHQYVVPGGPSYYDRSAWSSFNTMHPAGEGFAGEGNVAVWNFLGRLGGGAARIARGWPI